MLEVEKIYRKDKDVLIWGQGPIIRDNGNFLQVLEQLTVDGVDVIILGILVYFQACTRLILIDNQKVEMRNASGHRINFITGVDSQEHMPWLQVYVVFSLSVGLD